MNKSIRLFLTNIGIIIGESFDATDSTRTKIKQPLIMSPAGEGQVSFKTLPMAPEWAIIPDSAMEIEVPTGYPEAYEDAALSAFSGLIKPTQKESKLFLERR